MMLGATIIVFREVLEAALIIGIVAAATRGRSGRNRWVLAGVGAGVVGSLLVASLTGELASFADGVGQELFSAGVLGLAVLMLAWHNIWMSRHARGLARDAKQLGADVASGRRDMSAMALVVTLAVVREGSETALFMYSLMIGGDNSRVAIFLGGALGLALGAAAGFGLYAGFLRIPAKWFFSATSGLILLLAAAMASQFARVLIQADLLPSLASPLWDTSWLLTNNAPLGVLLHVLMGYEATPAGMQVVFYATALFLIAAGMRHAKTLQSPSS
jgi:high-affinity iron transporter